LMLGQFYLLGHSAVQSGEIQQREHTRMYTDGLLKQTPYQSYLLHVGPLLGWLSTGLCDVISPNTELLKIIDRYNQGKLCTALRLKKLAQFLPKMLQSVIRLNNRKGMRYTLLHHPKYPVRNSAASMLHSRYSD
jgi:hypothetical protein